MSRKINWLILGFSLLSVGVGLIRLSTLNSDLTVLSLLKCLGRSDINDGARYQSPLCAEEVSKFVADHSARMGSKGGSGSFLDSIVSADSWQSPNNAFFFMPVELPEYEYHLGLQGIEESDWQASLEHFERAATYRPRGWSSNFYQYYREVLDRVSPEVISRILEENQAVVAQEPQIQVGKMGQAGWYVPAMLDGGWKFDGLAVQSWTAVEYGFPANIDFFWKNPSNQQERQSVVAANMLPNGGFELGRNWQSPNIPGWYFAFQSQVDPLTDHLATRLSNTSGWWEGSPADYPQPVKIQTTVSPDGRFSTFLVLPSSGPKHYLVRMDSRLIPLEPQINDLVWSARIEYTTGGIPQIYVYWFDRNKTILSYVTPYSDVQLPDHYFAGVLKVPQDAAYVLVRLANYYTSSSQVWYDNLLLLPLSPPLTTGQEFGVR